MLNTQQIISVLQNNIKAFGQIFRYQSSITLQINLLKILVSILHFERSAIPQKRVSHYVNYV